MKASVRYRTLQSLPSRSGLRCWPTSQLGKLRSLAAGSGTDLGERPGRVASGRAAFTMDPRCSQLYLVRLLCGGLCTVVRSRLDDVGPDQIAPRVSLHAEACRDDIIEGLRVSHLNCFAQPPQRVALGAQREGRPIGNEAVWVNPVLPAARTDLLGWHVWHGIPAGAHSFQLCWWCGECRTGSFAWAYGWLIVAAKRLGSCPNRRERA